MDRLPDTISDQALLMLLGKILETDPTTQSSTELCSRLFYSGFSWQALIDLAVAHDVLPPSIFAVKERALLPPLPAVHSPEKQAAHVTSRLNAAYQRHLDRQHVLREQLRTALVALTEADIVPLLLKGVVHLTLAEPSWHLLHGLLHHQLADRVYARRLLAVKGLWEFSGAEICNN